MNKKLLFIFLFFSCIISNYVDVVYLKNGSIIKGIILEQIPNQTIKIETADGSIFVYDMNRVTKITREQLKI